MTTIWHKAHQDTAAEFLAALKKTKKDDLVTLAYNDLINSWCGDFADYKDGDKDPHSWGKRIPYLGWFWRSVDFANLRIPIGRSDFVGFMENNKWGHSERYLTQAEAEHVVGLIWRARKEGNKGGVYADAVRDRGEVLAELWDYLQGLRDVGDWSEEWAWRP